MTGRTEEIFINGTSIVIVMTATDVNNIPTKAILEVDITEQKVLKFSSTYYEVAYPPNYDPQPIAIDLQGTTEPEKVNITLQSKISNWFLKQYTKLYTTSELHTLYKNTVSNNLYKDSVIGIIKTFEFRK